MAEKVTVWTLNKATDLIKGKEKEIIDLFNLGILNLDFFGRHINCSFKNRDDYTVRNALDAPHNLMYEGENPFSEYFVPIPLKCIGKKYTTAPSLDNKGREILNGITQSFEYFKDQTHFKSFWDQGHGPLKKIRMVTKDYLGYYEILEKTKPNVLIGYSQGGLVARYLAFLDEHVFKKKAIAAIITISSPNYGSPLANPFNKESITDGINKLLLTLLSLNERAYSRLNKYVESKIDFEDITQLIDETLEDLYQKKSNKKKSERDFENMLAAAKKWLSGLENNASSAFYDLNIMRFHEDPYSVLNLVNA